MGSVVGFEMTTFAVNFAARGEAAAVQLGATGGHTSLLLQNWKIDVVCY